MNHFQFHQMGIYFLEGTNFWCDGGRLFGPVPKTLWEPLVYTNGNNEVSQTCDPILIRYQGQNILIDTAHGYEKLTEKEIRSEGVTGPSHLAESLAKVGVHPEEIHSILMTHMHNDHAGGLLVPEGKGYRKQFPNAKVYVNTKEWDVLRTPPKRTQGTYLEKNWRGIEDQVVLWSGYIKVMDGIELFHSKGHSFGHSVIKLTQEDQMIIHMADHLMVHLQNRPLWISGVDDLPLDTIESKEQWMTYGYENGAFFSFYHDPDYCLVKWNKTGQEIIETVKRNKPPLMPFAKPKP